MVGARNEAGRGPRAGVDIGGTFTDIVLVDDHTGEIWVGKTLTTPEAPARAVETGLRQVFAQSGRASAELALLSHATTLVTNALIERRGATTALITTRGFRDVLEIAREHRYDLHDLFIELPAPLVPRQLRLEVTERVAADGSVLIALDHDDARTAIAQLVQVGVEAVAVCLLHAYRNAAHEETLAELLRELAPHVYVSLSSDVAPEIREYERCSTTAANAYAQPLVARYVDDLAQRLRDEAPGAQLLIMLSNGGLAAPSTVRRYPVRMVESGPAAGAIAAAHFGAMAGRSTLLAFDMGGTTAKACLIDGGRPSVSPEIEVAHVYRFKRGSGLPIRSPSVDLIEIGAGGGSIARVNALGLLQVGPTSAGAAPGPACYGRGGTTPTVTDADLVLGYLDPSFFLGGAMSLDVDAARQAIVDQIGVPLGLDLTEAAWGIHQVANEQMASAARMHAVERGRDVRQYPILAFGGAGPVHADRIARILGHREWLAPLGAGVASAIGLLVAPLRFDVARSYHVRVDSGDWSSVHALLVDLEREALKLLHDARLSDDAASVEWFAGMRYLGQGQQITVPLPRKPSELEDRTEVVGRFESVYRRLYQRLCAGVPVEALGFRVTAQGPAGRAVTQAIKEGGPAEKTERLAYFPEAGGFVPTPVYDRYALTTGRRITGPALVEERETTLVVGVGSVAHVEDAALLRIEVPVD